MQQPTKATRATFLLLQASRCRQTREKEGLKLSLLLLLQQLLLLLQQQLLLLFMALLWEGDEGETRCLLLELLLLVE